MPASPPAPLVSAQPDLGALHPPLPWACRASEPAGQPCRGEPAHPWIGLPLWHAHAGPPSPFALLRPDHLQRWLGKGSPQAAATAAPAAAAAATILLGSAAECKGA